jgi:prophage regulatory protein
VSPDDLLGLAEVAELLERSPRTVRNYAKKLPGFPAPAATLRAGRVWRRRDVERWAAKNLPLKTGRPPKS